MWQRPQITARDSRLSLFATAFTHNSPYVSNISNDSSSRRQGEMVWISASNSWSEFKNLSWVIFYVSVLWLRMAWINVWFLIIPQTGEGRKIRRQLHFQSWVHINEGLKQAAGLRVHFSLQWQLSFLKLTFFPSTVYISGFTVLSNFLFHNLIPCLNCLATA